MPDAAAGVAPVMDYGHPIEFGVFITPTNQEPHAPVRLAQAAETAGFDLATFQDHPYQPAFHDTWTLLTWVAAQTSTIRIGPNVDPSLIRPGSTLRVLTQEDEWVETQWVVGRVVSVEGGLGDVLTVGVQ